MGSKVLSVALLGLGGYSRHHLGLIETFEKKGLMKLASVAIRNPYKLEISDRMIAMRKRGVSVFSGLDSLLEAQPLPDCIIIPTGIDQHAEPTIKALRAGCHVLCEKPAAGTVAELIAMNDAAKKSGKHLVFGYQHLSSPSMRRIKDIILSKRLGELRSITSWTLRPRSSAYYKRTYWAGKLSFGGRFVYDSPLQNGLAHHLHAALWVAGAAGTSAMPVEVYGENYTGKGLNCADTQYVRILTDTNVRIVSVVTHACSEEEGPATEYICEKGRIRWFLKNSRVDVFESDQTHPIETFDNGTMNLHEKMYEDFLATVNDDKPAASSFSDALAHTVSIESLFTSCETVAIPREYIYDEKVDVETYDRTLDARGAINSAIKGIEESLRAIVESKGEKSFADLGCSWARYGETVSVKKIGRDYFFIK